MAKSDEKTALHVGFVETFRIFKPSYRTDSYGTVQTRNHEIPAIAVYLFIDILLFSLSLSFHLVL